MAFLRMLLAPDAARPRAVPWPLLGAIVVIAVSVRILYAIVFPIDHEFALTDDGWGVIAYNLAQGKGYTSPDSVYDNKLSPNIERLPVPVLFYAALFSVFGRSVYAVWIANWLLEAIAIVLAYFIALEIFSSRRLALLASFLIAIYVPAALHTQSALSVSIFTALTAGFILCFLVAVRKRSAARIAWAGLLLGLAAMSQPSLLAFPAYCLFFLLYYLRDMRIVIRYFVIMCAVFLLVPIPWIVRNYVTFGKFIPATTLLGLNLYRNNANLDQDNYILLPSHREVKEMTRARFAADGLDIRDHDPVTIDGYQRNLAMDKIRQRPGRYLVGCGYRFVRLWFNLGWGTPASMQSYLVAVLNTGILLTALAAFLFFRGRWMQPSWFLVALILHHVLLFVLVNANVRYMMPFMHYVSMFCACTLLGVWDRVTGAARLAQA